MPFINPLCCYDFLNNYCYTIIKISHITRFTKWQRLINAGDSTSGTIKGWFVICFAGISRRGRGNGPHDIARFPYYNLTFIFLCEAAKLSRRFKAVSHLRHSCGIPPAPPLHGWPLQCPPGHRRAASPLLCVAGPAWPDLFSHKRCWLPIQSVH